MRGFNTGQSNLSARGETLFKIHWLMRRKPGGGLREETEEFRKTFSWENTEGQRIINQEMIRHFVCTNLIRLILIMGEQSSGVPVDGKLTSAKIIEGVLYDIAKVLNAGPNDLNKIGITKIAETLYFMQLFFEYFKHSKSGGLHFPAGRFIYNNQAIPLSIPPEPVDLGLVPNPYPTHSDSFPNSLRRTRFLSLKHLRTRNPLTKKVSSS